MIVVAALGINLAACSYAGQAKKKEELGFQLADKTEETNISFTHEKPSFDEKANNIMPWLTTLGASVSVADFNNDGYMDVFFTNSQKGSSNALFQNNGDGTFTDVTKESKLGSINQEGISTSAVWFDYNNNGYQDIYIAGWGQSKLFENNGDGTFTDVTEESNTGFSGNVGKAITLDYDQDGHLDLYLGNYFQNDVDLWNLETTKIMHNDFERAANGGENLLFKNNGDGTFTNVSEEMGVHDSGWTLAPGSADINNDGYPDLYNANDFGPDTLYINDEGKGFKEVEQNHGIGDDTYKGMNTSFADLFHEGQLGIYISNVSKPRYILEGNQFWYPNEDGKYEDKAEELGINLAGFSWGASFTDLNNSGDLDLVVTNGFISASEEDDYWFELGTLATTPGNIIEDTKNWPAFNDKSLSGYEEKFLFLNDGNGKLTDVAEDAQLDFTYDGRGVAPIDFDNDGDMDLIFANQNAPAKVYENETTDDSNWINLDLEGTEASNRDAVGAKVLFTIDGEQTLMERDGGNGYATQRDPRLHIGTGESEVVENIKITWPSGGVEEFKNIKVNQFLKIKEGEGIIGEEET